MNPFRAYLRLRHAHGFGVHSPFAYDLVKSVVTPGGYAYYGYEDIEEAIAEGKDPDIRCLRRKSRMLLRLLVFLQTKRLFAASNCGLPLPFKAAAKAAATKTLPLSGALPGDIGGNDLLLITGESQNPCQTAARVLKRGCPVMALQASPAMGDAMRECLHEGLLLCGKDTFLAVPRPGMAFTEYSILF